MVPVEYVTSDKTFLFMMWFFRFITGIIFKWDYVLSRIIDMLVWVGIWTKLRIYRVPPDSVRWS